MSNEATPSNPKLEQGAASDESIVHVHDQLLHDQHEPKEGYTWMPLILLGLVSSVIFVVAVYFIHHRGGFSPMVYDERFDPQTMGAAIDRGPVDPTIAGRRHYNQACAQCHQPNGQGLPGAFPPLAGADWVLGDEETLIRIVVHGLHGPIEVKGNTYNGIMPGFGLGTGFNWNDQRISDVLTYIRSEWGNDAPPIPVERVTELRLQGAPSPQGWTVQQLAE